MFVHFPGSTVVPFSPLTSVQPQNQTLVVSFTGNGVSRCSLLSACSHHFSGCSWQTCYSRHQVLPCLPFLLSSRHPALHFCSLIFFSLFLSFSITSFQYIMFLEFPFSVLNVRRYKALLLFVTTYNNTRSRVSSCHMIIQGGFLARHS